jgi:hypothetical protein
MEGVHVGVGDGPPGRVVVLIEPAPDLEAGLRGRCGDELDDDLVADERLASPVLADRAEQPVLDLVPLARPGREVADGDLEAGLVGELLEFQLPETEPVAVAPAGVPDKS